jgi:hypothetical protein
MPGFQVKNLFLFLSTYRLYSTALLLFYCLLDAVIQLCTCMFHRMLKDPKVFRLLIGKTYWSDFAQLKIVIKLKFWIVSD